jgi:hypothetical protein
MHTGRVVVTDRPDGATQRVRFPVSKRALEPLTADTEHRWFRELGGRYHYRATACPSAPTRATWPSCRSRSAGWRRRDTCYPAATGWR